MSGQQLRQGGIPLINANDETLNISNSGYHFEGQDSISTKRMKTNDVIYDSNEQINMGGRTNLIMNQQQNFLEPEDKEGLEFQRY